MKYLTGTTNWPTNRESAERALLANGYIKASAQLVPGNDTFIKGDSTALICGEQFPDLHIDYLADKPVQSGQYPYIGTPK